MMLPMICSSGVNARLGYPRTMDFLKTGLWWSLVVCSSMLLTACGFSHGYNSGSSFYRAQLGSQVKLHRALPLPPGRTRVFLQRGARVTNNLDQYYPHCNFEVRSLSDEARLIAPDIFLVTRLQQGFEEVVSLESIRVAALEPSAWYPTDDVPMVSRYLYLYLASERQPDVMRLTCHGAFDFMPDAQWPTIEEIREALGGIAELQKSPLPGIIK